MALQTDPEPRLASRVARRLLISLGCLAGMLFLPAGSLRFWQGWLFVGLMGAFWTFFFAYFLRHDPHILERRMQRVESDPAQKLFQKLSMLLTFPGLILVALDFRFGWTRHWLGPVPVAVVLIGQTGTLAGYWFVFWVMQTNTFASSTIRVEQQQTVIDRGPYAWVRHPMYVGIALAMFSTPLALGSYVMLPWFALYLPLLTYRLIHEEQTLRRDLPGYVEYCQRVRFRLLPGIW